MCSTDRNGLEEIEYDTRSRGAEAFHGVYNWLDRRIVSTGLVRRLNTREGV